jgi:hypothetical protein
VNQNEMMAVVEESWRQLDMAVAGLDEVALIEPGVVDRWSIKDLLGHVTAWNQLVVQHLERWRRGEPPLPRTWASTDEYNASEAARRQDWSLTQVLDEASATRQRLGDLLGAITDEEWGLMVTIGERERTLGEWVGGALSGESGPGTHAAEHAAQIQAWRVEREGQGA